MSRKSKVLPENLASIVKKYASSDVVESMARQYARSTILNIPVTTIQDNRWLEKIPISEVDIQKTRQSIEAKREVAPLILRPVGNDYEIVLGRRRYHTALSMDIKELPAIIMPFTDDEMMLTIITNLRQSREDNALSIAVLAQALHDDYGYTQNALAIIGHMSRSTMANLMRLNKISSVLQIKLIEGKLTYGHVRSLINLEPQQQVILAKQAVAKHWSVRRLEQAIVIARTYGIDKVIDMIESNNGLRIQTMGKRLVITFESKREIDDFLAKLKLHKLL
jgi:ParB family chromosome partitioning protein